MKDTLRGMSMGMSMTCPKCGNEMREGALYIPNIMLPVQGQAFMSDSIMVTPSTLSQLSGPGTFIQEKSVDGPQWREEKRHTTGLLPKRREIQTLRIQGQRCLNCGYIELWAK